MRGRGRPVPGGGGVSVRSGAMLRLGLLIAALIVVLDQATKWWLLDLMDGMPRVVEVTPFFNLVLGFNRGVSFGLFDSGGLGPWPLLVLAAVITVRIMPTSPLKMTRHSSVKETRSSHASPSHPLRAVNSPRSHCRGSCLVRRRPSPSRRAARSAAADWQGMTSR